MPPKKEVKPILKGFKIGVPPKDFVPPEFKQPVREPHPIKIPNEFNSNHNPPLYQAFPELEEWPGDEVAQNFDFGLESNSVFKGGKPIQLPASFSLDSKMILWRRPIDFIKDLIKLNSSPRAKKVREDKAKLNRRATSLLKPLDDQELEAYISQTDLPKTTIKIFDTIEREEEEWETELRLKEVVNEKNKKKGTKAPQINEEEGKAMVKVAVLNDIDMSGIEYSNFSKWIASVLQIIKDRNINDVYTEKPICSKVYPQVRGIPVYNPSGRYWVKLYFMGKERKIEIDDKFPVNVESKCLFPRSEQIDEIWPMILSKALLILSSYIGKSQDSSIETGQGLFMHALTGLIPQTIKIDSKFSEKMKYLSFLMSDHHYLNNTCFLTCYCLPGHKPMVPNSFGDKKNKFDPPKIIPHAAKSITRRNSMYSADLDRAPGLKAFETPSNIIPGFLYSLSEIFANENFNMVYVLKRSDDEIKYRQEYYNLSKQTMHKMSKDEKLDYRKLKKELREKIADEEKKRIELITKSPIQYKLLKINSNAKDSNINKFSLPFTEHEIFLAKKCIINKLARPPNYDMPEIKGDDKSMYSQAQSQGAASGFEIKPLEEFNIPNCKEPLKRDEGGSWLTEKDFKICFHFVQVYFNPKKLKSHSILTAKASPENYLTIDYEHEIIKILKSENDVELNDHSTLLIGFLPTEAMNKEIDPSPSLVLEKINNENFKVESHIITLTNKMDSFLHHYDDSQHQYFRTLVLSPLSYVIWLSSDTEHKAMSITQFLKEELNYTSNTFNIDHINVEMNTEYIFGKFSFKSDNQTNIYLKINHPDKFALEFFNLKIFEIPPDNISVMLDSIEGVEKNLYETVITALNINKIKLNENTKYIISIEGKFPSNLAENSMQIEILYHQNECNLEVIQFEMCEPLEFGDSYKPNKYGLIFKERIFVHRECHCSLYLKLELGKDKSVKQIEGDDKIKPRNKIPIKLELLEEDKVLYWSTGDSSSILSSIYLVPTKKYFLNAFLDKRELKDNDLSAFNEMAWNLRLYCTESMAILKDTDKEEREMEIIKSWETSQIGRSEKAKNSRAKYLAQMKAERGEELTENEIAIIKAPRTINNEKKEEEKGKKGAPPVKGKVPTKQVPQSEEKLDIATISFPKSSECNMEEIVQFLERLEDKRVKIIYPEHQGLITVRSPIEGKELINKSLMSAEEGKSFLNERLVEWRSAVSNDLEIKKRDFSEKIKIISQEFISKKESINQTKKELKKSILAKKELQNTLLSLLSSEHINCEEIEKIISGNEFPPELTELAGKVLLKSKFENLIEKLNQGIENFEIESLTEALNQIEDLNYDIDPELYDKAAEMIEEARINPNFVAEKLAETKKAGKKPGKK